MDQDSEVDPSFTRRQSFDAMERARINASQGIGKAVEATKHNRQIAECLWFAGNDIGWLERTATGWAIVSQIEAVSGYAVAAHRFPQMPTAEQAIEEAILTVAGYLWLRALGDIKRVFKED